MKLPDGTDGLSYMKYIPVTLRLMALFYKIIGCSCRGAEVTVRPLTVLEICCCHGEGESAVGADVTGMDKRHEKQHTC